MCTLTPLSKFLTLSALIFCFISGLQAATLSMDDENSIDNPEINFEMELEPVQQEASDTNNVKQSSEIINAQKKTSAAISSGIDTAENSPQSSLITSTKTEKKQAQSYDIVNQAHEKISTIVEEEVLDDTVSFLKNANSKLNKFNQKIDQKFSPLVEKLAISNELAKNNKAYRNSENKSNTPTYGNSDNVLLKIWGYIFNIENIIKLILVILFLTGIVKVIHFVSNRMY